MDKNQANMTMALSLRLEKYGTIYRPRISSGECFGKFENKIFGTVVWEYISIL